MNCYQAQDRTLLLDKDIARKLLRILGNGYLDAPRAFEGLPKDK